jgi:hypothetical protein
MGTFSMRVRRSVDAPEPAPAAVAAAAPPAAAPASFSAVSNAAAYLSMDAEPPHEESMDEALVYVTVPKVRADTLSGVNGAAG